MYLKIMFYSEALNSCQSAPILGSYAILHYWALVLGLYLHSSTSCSMYQIEDRIL